MLLNSLNLNITILMDLVKESQPTTLSKNLVINYPSSFLDPQHLVRVPMFNIGLVITLPLGMISISPFPKFSISIFSVFLSSVQIFADLLETPPPSFVPDGCNLELSIHLPEITMITKEDPKNPTPSQTTHMFSVVQENHFN